MDILHANDYMMAQTHIRLFHRLFYKVSLFYATNVPKSLRRAIDRIMLIQASCCLFLLLYVHLAFLSDSGTCLDDIVETWPRDGIVRVQINTTADQTGSDLQDGGYVEEYVMEYSLHYAFLRMDTGLRRNMSIPISDITLEKNNLCFGNWFSRLLLDTLFGYDDVLMSSFKKIAANVSNKGFLRNVVTGEHYRFIDMWLNKLNYVFSFILMIILTSVIAMLMRLCHHQLFKFFCKLLFALQQNQMHYPVWMPFPIASLLTMFLGLWGLETIMTELLDDPMVSFHLIAFVWMADNYYTICCHSQISKKHFPRFFYLSSYLFYAFHNQFNGQFSGLALVATFMTTQLCMVYFYHRYELPVIEFFISRSRRERQENNPLSVEALVTSLVQLQQNDYVSLEPYSSPAHVLPTRSLLFNRNTLLNLLRERLPAAVTAHLARYPSFSRFWTPANTTNSNGSIAEEDRFTDAEEEYTPTNSTNSTPDSTSGFSSSTNGPSTVEPFLDPEPTGDTSSSSSVPCESLQTDTSSCGLGSTANTVIRRRELQRSSQNSTALSQMADLPATEHS